MKKPKKTWKFVENPPDQSSADSEWYALSVGGYIKPHQVLADPAQVEEVNAAVETLLSFFAALRAAGLREEM